MKAAGGRPADVAQIQVYLVDKADAPGFNRIYRELISAPYPVRDAGHCCLIMSPVAVVECDANLCLAPGHRVTLLYDM